MCLLLADARSVAEIAVSSNAWKLLINGEGRWSLHGIKERYAAYARRLRVSSPLDLKPTEHEEHSRHWIYSVMFQVVEGIEKGDEACIAIGVEFIEEDERFSFGRIIKSNTARALRRADLTSEQIERIRKRIVHMLITERVPREYHEYAKLLRKVGLGDWWPVIEEQVNRNNPYVMRHYEYFQQYVRTK
jgi:hypothetical protein